MPSSELHSLAGLIKTFVMRTEISCADRADLLTLPLSTRIFEAGTYLVREGDRLENFGVLVKGLAYKHKQTREGLRQIVSISAPGEIFNLHDECIKIADHNIQTLTQCQVAHVDGKAMLKLIETRPAIARAMSALAHVELAIAREWLLNVGRRDARTRIAFLFCELSIRLNNYNHPFGQSFEIPMTQEHLGDALGLTAVHINRMINYLAGEKLVIYKKRAVEIPDWNALVRFADFNSRYLHIGDVLTEI